MRNPQDFLPGDYSIVAQNYSFPNLVCINIRGHSQTTDFEDFSHSPRLHIADILVASSPILDNVVCEFTQNTNFKVAYVVRRTRFVRQGHAVRAKREGFHPQGGRQGGWDPEWEKRHCQNMYLDVLFYFF